MIGKTVILYNKVQTGVDKFNKPVYEEIPEIVKNILIGLPESVDIVNEITLDSKKAAYVLGIPKGDDHIWENRTVEFFGKKFKTYGFVIEGIEENVPTRWHKKVMVERYA